MFSVFKARFIQGYRTGTFPDKAPQLPERFLGRPVVDQEKCRAEQERYIEICPAGAIAKCGKGIRLDLGKCIFCGKCREVCDGGIRFSKEHAVAAMKKGRHVFIEKPLCLTEREADELLDMQKKTGVSVQVGQVIRFWDEYEYLRGAVGDGRFGAVKGAHFLRRSPSPDWGWDNWLHDPARSGGAGFDLHIHDSDYMLSLFGQPASSVSAVNVRGEKNGYVTTLAFYDGFSVTAEGGWDLPANYPFEMAYSAVFERETPVSSDFFRFTLE